MGFIELIKQVLKMITVAIQMNLSKLRTGDLRRKWQTWQRRNDRVTLWVNHGMSVCFLLIITHLDIILPVSRTLEDRTSTAAVILFVLTENYRPSCCNIIIYSCCNIIIYSCCSIIYIYIYTYIYIYVDIRYIYTLSLTQHGKETMQETGGGDLAPSLGGRKNFRGPKFLNDVFSGKNFHFHAQKFC